MRTRFYHASPRRFRHGDVLTGGHPGGYGVAHRNVCMTGAPQPHGTILEKALSGDWHVYEVEPLDEVRFNDYNGEFQSRSARVLRKVGSARGLAAKRGPEGKYCPHKKAYYSWPLAVPRRGIKADIARGRIWGGILGA